jgi:putative DNA primase/helicase
MEPSFDLVGNFRDAMHQAGIVTDDPIIADGVLHRIHVNGDRSGSRNGWYVLHGDEFPAGFFGSWKYGDEVNKWYGKEPNSLPAGQRRVLQAKMEKAQQERRAERERLRLEAGKRAQDIWKAAPPAPADHSYLKAKGAAPHDLRVHNGSLVVPVSDAGGNLKSLQFIAGDGTKKFLPGGAIRGNYHTIGKPLNIIYIVEGYATGATVHAATGQMVVVAFNASNLEPVAKVIKEKHPGLQLVIAADNDTGTEGNPGMKHGQKAAQAVGGILVYPQFKEGQGSDFNDLQQVSGLAAVKKQLESPVEAFDQLAAVTTESTANKAEQQHLIDELAKLDLIDYDRRRGSAAKELGCRATTLDKLVAVRRDEVRQEENLSALKPGDVEPWPNSVSGADLLDEIADTATRFAVLPKHADTAIALWVLFSYLHDHAYTCPMLGLMSPEKRCGKTTCIGLLSKLVHRPLAASNISASALFRAIEKWQPTLIVDEADTFIHSSDELRGVLNSGHTRDTAFVVRTCGDDHEPARFSTWGPKAFALIGRLPDTLQDRSIVVWLQRKTADQTVEKRRRHHNPDFLELQQRAARWAQDNAKAFEHAPLEDINGLNDRAADNWEPLIQIAKLAGGDWPEHATKAALALSGSVDGMGEDSIRIELRKDIRLIFEQLEGDDRDRLTSHRLVDKLVEMEDRPWPEFKRGKPISNTQVARLLKPFGIRPKVVRIGNATPRGYTLAAFMDAFSRYLPPVSRNNATN